MSMGAALKGARAVELATQVIAIELLCASQAIDLLAPLETSARLKHVHTRIRRDVPALGADRPPAPDIAALAALISGGAFSEDTSR